MTPPSYDLDASYAGPIQVPKQDLISANLHTNLVIYTQQEVQRHHLTPLKTDDIKFLWTKILF